MHIKKLQNHDKIDLNKKISPNYIANRFDLKYEDDYDLWEIEAKDEKYYIPTHISGKQALIGVAQTPLPSEVFTKFIEHCFQYYPKTTRISCSASVNNYCNNLVLDDQWILSLPNTEEAYKKSLSKKTRHNINWYPKKIQKDYGDFSITHRTASETDDATMQLFDKWKHEKYTAKTYSNLGSRNFQTSNNVTDVYSLIIADNPAALVFVSITDDSAYLQNLSYNPEFANYSPGIVLLYSVISDLIQNNLTTLYMGGGSLEYKRRMGGENRPAYHGIIIRPGIRYFPQYLVYNLLLTKLYHSNSTNIIVRNLKKLLRTVLPQVSKLKARVS